MFLSNFIWVTSTLVCICSANTEAFFFRAPEDVLPHHDNITDKTPIIHVDNAASVTFSVSAPLIGDASEYWLLLEGVEPSSFYNARFSWSALDPIDLIHFDLVTIERDTGTQMWLKLETSYKCFTKDSEFMMLSHQVTGTILVSSTVLGFVPQDLVPLLALISTVLSVSFVAYKHVYRFLRNLK